MRRTFMHTLQQAVDPRTWIRASGDTTPDDVPDQLWIEADGAVEIVEAAAGEDGAKLKKFKMIAYTGGLMRPSGFGTDVVLDLSTTKVAAGARPILLQHDPLKPLGHSAPGQIKIDNRIEAEGVLSAANELVDQVQASSANGFPWKASIGAPYKRIKYVADGETAQVNGKSFKGPLYVVSDATLMEISFVALAGDDRTSAKVMAQGGQSKEGSTMKFSEWLKAAGFAIADLTAGQLKPLRAAWKAEHAEGEDDAEAAIKAAGPPTAPPAPPVVPPATGGGGSLTAAAGDLVAEFRAAQAAEIERTAKIRQICASANLTEENRDTIMASAVRDNWSVERTELEVLRKARPSGGDFAIHAGAGGQANATAGVLVASFCQTLGVPQEVTAAGISQQDMDKATSIRHRYTTLHALMDMVILQATGVHWTGDRKSNEFIRAAKRADRQLMAGGEYNSLNASSGFTTISLTGILGNVANKLMMAAFQAQETVYQYLSKPVPHSDFKVHTRYRLNATGGYQEIGPDGELKHSGLTETSETSQLKTYGTILGLNRQQMINDDLGAFEAIPTMLGQMAPKKREEIFFELFLAATTFTAGKKNLLTGAAYALGIDGMSKAIQFFSDQVGPDNKPILVSPDRLLVPTNLFDPAKRLYTGEYVNETTAAGKPAPNKNPHSGLFSPYKSPYLNNTAIKDVKGKAIANQSTTAWYLLANPQVLAAFIFATLMGHNMPYIESDETDFNTLGMQWRAYDDFGVGQGSPEGAVKVTGVD